MSIHLETVVIELLDRVKELERRQNNQINSGVIVAVDGAKVNIELGEYKTGFIHVIQQSLGNVKTWRQPVIGESCLVINVGTGEDPNNAYALIGLPSADYKPPSLEPGVLINDYGNGMVEIYDLENGSLNASYPGGLNITATTKITGDTTIEGKADITGKSTAADHLSGKSKISGKGHTHMQGSYTTPKGGPVTGSSDKPA